MRGVLLLVLLAVSATPQSAIADDTSANFLLRLFMNVCIPNVGQPERVRAWAAEKHLQEITNPIALHVFVGSGGKGVAWAVPAAFGSFALSVRGETEGCATWAQVANPAEVEGYFRKIVEGAARPGVDVGVVKDNRDPSPSGTVHTVVYSVSGTDKEKGGFLYTMVTAERSGGPFQASLQAARFARP
jgi:hypothetical protein